MAMLVMGLFDDSESAEKALGALEAAGFSREDIDVRSGDRLADTRDRKRADTAKEGDGDEGMLARIRHYLSDIGLSGKGDASAKKTSAKRSAADASGAGSESGERELGDSDVLILVDTTDDMAEQAADILGEYGVTDLAADGAGCVRVYSVIVEGDVTRPAESTLGEAAAGRQARASEANAGRLSAQEERDFQNDWQARYASTTGLSSDEALPGYQYGYRLGQNPQLSDREWSAVETQAQRDWDERRFGPWERLKQAVKSGWERAHRH
jgi:hypothetical protein